MIRKQLIILLIAAFFTVILQGSAAAAEIDGGEIKSPENLTDSEGRFTFMDVTDNNHVVWVDH